MKRESKFCEGRIMFELNIDKEIFLEIQDANVFKPNKFEDSTIYFKDVINTRSPISFENIYFFLKQKN